MGNLNSIHYVSYNFVQQYLYNDDCLLINTLPANKQLYILSNTVNITNEETRINALINQRRFDNVIIIYGNNNCDDTVYRKYCQLKKLGFKNCYIYPGGLFEWLCLQDIFGKEEFPTTKYELDIYKYRPKSKFNEFLLLENID